MDSRIWGKKLLGNGSVSIAVRLRMEVRGKSLVIMSKDGFSADCVKILTSIARNCIIFVTCMFLYCVICFRSPCIPGNNQ